MMNSLKIREEKDERFTSQEWSLVERYITTDFSRSTTLVCNHMNGKSWWRRFVERYPSTKNVCFSFYPSSLFIVNDNNYIKMSYVKI